MYSKTLLLFLVVYFLSDVTYGQKDKKFFRKDYTYIESVESFYKVHTIPRTFADAKQICALEGASLFYAENRGEADAVISFWNRTQPNIHSVFVGLNDIKVEGFFETVDQKPIADVYSKWHRHQPNNKHGKQDCVHMDLKAIMNDYYCYVPGYYICKKTLKSLEWNNYCDIYNLDYTYNNDFGKCYKLHTTPMNWTEAYAMCRVEYTSLALISSQLEADYLAKLTVTANKPRVNGKYQRGIYHLGFHNNEGWKTVEGTPLNVDAALWFDNFQPAVTSEAECGSMFFNGRLINTDCGTKSLFICEHKVHISDESLSTGLGQIQQ